MRLPETRKDRSPSGSVCVRSVGAITIDVALIAVLLALLPQTLDLGEAARRFPLVTTAVLVALLTLDLLMELVPAARRRLGFLEADLVGATPQRGVPTDAGVDSQEALGPEGQSEQPHRAFSQWGALAWLTGLGVGMFYLGYLIVTPIFLVLFFLWARVPIKVAVGITAALSLFNYFVFYEYLGLQ